MNWQTTSDVLRLARSFRQFVDPTGPVIVVQNSRDGGVCRRHGLDSRGFRQNVYHGPSLDWGMRSVTSEYVLICDPDSIIVSRTFEQEIRDRLAAFNVAGIRISRLPKHDYYHPICLAFRTELWKRGGWSLNADWSRPEPNDAASELTHLLGGVQPAALLPQTRSNAHAHVYADCFSATFGMSRVAEYGDEDIMDGHAHVGERKQYHAAWREWADEVLAGRQTVEELPPGPPDVAGG